MPARSSSCARREDPEGRRERARRLDRRKEHLVPADALVIRLRRRMLQAAVDLRAGIEPPMLAADDPRDIAQRYPSLIPDGID